MRTLSLALAAASCCCASLASASSSPSGHPAHGPAPGAHGAGSAHDVFRRAAAGPPPPPLGAVDPPSLLVERAAELAQQHAVDDAATLGGEGRLPVMQMAGMWTDEDELWASEGSYGLEGAGPLQRRGSVAAQNDSATSSGSEGTDDADEVLTLEDLQAKLLVNPKWLLLNPKWTPKSTATTASRTSAAASPSSTAGGAATITASSAIVVPSPTQVPCALTADCANAGTIPDYSNRYCNNGMCSWRCRSGYVSSGLTCIRGSLAGSSDAAITTTAAASATTTTKTSTATIATTLPAPPASTCQPGYTDTTGGVVYGAQVGNAPFMPRPSTFVKRSGNQLTLDGETFRIVGPNIYWLGLDENVNWSVSYPSHGRIREAMAITVAMGGNTIRSHTLGCSTGHSKTLWPTAYNTNEAAWDTIDYAIYAARAYGLRLIIPLTDNYAYYHGGKYDFIRWGGANTDDGSQFYSNSKVIAIFKDYISVVLNHVNTYTGVALKDDPTILAWETGNELGGYMLGGGAPPASWTKDIAAYIKNIAPNHLVADGTDGLSDYGGSLANTGVGVSNVDLVTDHFYPAQQWLLEKDQNWMKSYSDKVFFVGENDWTWQKGGSNLNTFYSTIENWSGSGSMMWSIFGHDDRCCDWIYHNDGYSLYYPNGNSGDLLSNGLRVAKHWYRMRGLTPPSVYPAVACPQPEITG
ncbi:uncharacterized protein JCM10292_004017 [Rhodotorula paludigena]|uniref:uncharacterized protein n=1 Tax=Rhodotorula paludigena TaxID=86838 RepID=UPI0031741D19